MVNDSEKMNPAEWAPGTVVRWRHGADQILSHRKDDETGWWLTDGSGLVDTAWNSGDWRVVRHPTRQWVVGFLLDTDATQVVLIRKNRPDWQAGKLNGVGGKVEPGEGLRDAMAREFLEETGRTVEDWHHFLDLTWEQGVVHFLRSFASWSMLDECATVTDEEIEVHTFDALLAPGNPLRATPNLLWLIPLAAHRHDTYEVIKVVETGTTLREVGRSGDDPDGVHRSSIGAMATEDQS